MKKVVLAGLILMLLVAPLYGKANYNSTTAQDYLVAHSGNPWSVMALKASGASSISSGFLKSVNGSSAIDYSAPILAITALGEDPKTFGSKDYVAELKKYYTSGQLGDTQSLNDDIFGLLALISAGEQTSEPILSNTKSFILAHQQNNGGWGFSTSSGSDSNMTAAAITALIASGTPASDSVITKGLEYLKTAQNSDGGFTYDPTSQFGTSSDSSSTAWVIWAINAAGISPTDWSKNGNSPTKYLEDNQVSEGYFEYQNGSGEDAFSPVTTSYAVIALLGKTLPLQRASSTAKFNFQIEGKNSSVCSGKTEGPTALDVVKNASLQCGFSYNIATTSFGPYLNQIGEDKAEGLIGWLYLVNYTPPQVGASEFVLKPGDSVLWFFGDYNWKPTRLSLSKTEVASEENSNATVESFDNGSWSPLNEAKVFYGALNTNSDSTGKAVIVAPDGYYKIFAEKEGFIRSNNVTLKVGNIAGNTTELKVNIGEGKVEGATISFTVNPSNLDFGTMKAGQTTEKSVTVSNTGTVNIAVVGIVKGDEVFTKNIFLDNASWQNFQKNISHGSSQPVNSKLAIPASYQGGTGSKSGSITFWATVQ